MKMGKEDQGIVTVVVVTAVDNGTEEGMGERRMSEKDK